MEAGTLANRRTVALALLLGAAFGFGRGAVMAGEAAAKPQLLDECEIEPVCSGHYVGFDFLQEGDWQVAAYYDAKRRMTLASRKTGDQKSSGPLPPPSMLKVLKFLPAGAKPKAPAAKRKETSK